LGSARFGRGEFAAAEEAFEAAQELFAGLGEKPNRIAMDSMLAALHEWVGANARDTPAMSAGMNQKLERTRSQSLKTCPLTMMAPHSFACHPRPNV
jgi:hypothetical protein